MGQGRRLLFGAAGHGFERHVAVLELPLVVLFEQDGSDEPRDDASYNVANFVWRALLDRDSLRARYGEGFRNGPMTG